MRRTGEGFRGGTHGNLAVPKFLRVVRQRVTTGSALLLGGLEGACQRVSGAGVTGVRLKTALDLAANANEKMSGRWTRE